MRAHRSASSRSRNLRMLIKPPDSELEQRVLHELRLQPDLESREICVLCHDGLVTLRGTVSRPSNRLAAARAVHRLRDITGLTNLLKVDSRNPEISVDLSIAAPETPKRGHLPQQPFTPRPTSIRNQL